MQFSVDPSIFEQFPGLHLVALVTHDIDNSSVPAEIRSLQEHEQFFARGIFTTESISSHPNIAAWRKAYTTFGAGSHYRSSVESLVRRVVKGGDLPRINTLVDLYNIASLKYLVPIGGEDLQKVKGDVRLYSARGDEHFVSLGEPENDPPHEGEIIYGDDAGCICRRFNWREADRTKLTSKTKNGLLVIEGLPPVTDIELKEAAAGLEKLITAFCGGKTELFLLNQNQPTITFTL